MNQRFLISPEDLISGMKCVKVKGNKPRETTIRKMSNVAIEIMLSSMLSIFNAELHFKNITRNYLYILLAFIENATLWPLLILL